MLLLLCCTSTLIDQIPQFVLDELRTKEPRHPHVRSLIRILNELGLLDAMATEPTKMTMLIDSEGDWVGIGLFYTVHVSPRLGSSKAKKHASRANAWIVHSKEQSVSDHYMKSKLWKKIPYGGKSTTTRPLSPPLWDYCDHCGYACRSRFAEWIKH